MTRSAVANVPVSEDRTTFGDGEVAGARVDGELDGSFEGRFASRGVHSGLATADDGLDKTRRAVDASPIACASIALSDEEIPFSVEGEGEVGFSTRAWRAGLPSPPKPRKARPRTTLPARVVGEESPDPGFRTPTG